MRIREHVRGCEACKIALSVANGISRSTDADVTDEPVTLATGTTVGRFLIVEPVGRGAMGQVYSAYDPALDRKVALKFLTAQAPGDLDDPRALRLLREARALATVAHPNVVTVHDLGVFDGHPYVAMEFVDGTTLGGWLEARERSTREILDAYAAAGAGLVAAHARGLVHRDFKPDNVLVGKDGRVCVTDFGLVRWAASDPELPPQQAGDVLLNDAAQTRTGALVGTPAYMAPEQLRGGVADARSDQFSFCVALWEALTGDRPFRGRTLVDLLSAIKRGRPSADGLPRSVANVLARGLAYDADARHGSMQLLLSRLQTGRRSLGWIAAAVGTALAGGVGFVAASPGVLDSAQAGYCAAVTDRLDSVWGPTHRETLARALREQSAPHLEPAVRSVLGRLDAYATQWTELVSSQCEAEAAGTVPTSVSAIRMACLQRRLDHAEALIVALTDAGPAALDHAVTAADKLPSLDSCLSDAVSAGRVGLDDPALSAELVTRIDSLVARATTQTNLGRLDDAALTADEGVTAARELGHKGLLTDALDVLGRIRLAQGQLEDALSVFVEGTESAVAARYHRGAYVALANRAFVLGGRRNEPDRAEELLELARAELEAAGGDAQLEADSLSVLATIKTRRGDFAAAVELYQAVVDKRESIAETSVNSAAIGYANLGSALNRIGRTSEGIEALRRAEAGLLETLGPRHRSVISVRGNLLSAQLALGKNAEVVTSARQAVADATVVLGADNPELGVLLGVLARAQFGTGDTLSALDNARRALRVFVVAFGEDHPNAVNERAFIVVILRRDGQREEALSELERVVAAAERDPSQGIQLADALRIRASFHVEAREHEAALAATERALQIQVEQYGEDSAVVAGSREARGLALLEVGRVDEGIAEMQKALRSLSTQRQQGHVGDAALGLSEARLAMVLATHRPNHERISGLVESARARLRDTPADSIAHDEAAQWLAAQ